MKYKKNKGFRYSKVSGERLKIAMSVAEISNSELSRRINVDASLISRYRSGGRRFPVNSELAGKLRDVLWERIERSGRLNVLAEMMSISREELSRETFLSWLSASDLSDDESVERLFHAFDSYSTETGIKLPNFNEVAPESVLSSDDTVYYGYEGLREAVIRFLGNVAKSRSKELLLYSDQNMDWLTEDSVFRLKWASLMNECIKNGTRILIIHNIERSLNEMNEAIISWLPLYMSGMIEPYYCKKSAGNRFSSTVFLSKGEFCIAASHVSGTERKGIYRFITSPAELSVYDNYLQRLFNMSSPLIKIRSGIIPETDQASTDFRNISITVSKDEVVITKIKEPCFSFAFSHPRMIQSFVAYLERK